MNRLSAIRAIRQELADGRVSLGSWIQLPGGSVAEIMGRAGYAWVAVDLEHGSISVSDLPDMFRALELGNTLPLARLAQGDPKDCKQALDAGAGGVIVPMVESAAQLVKVRDACRWPPAGTRGVGFSRANLHGGDFDTYAQEAQAPLLVAMVENAAGCNAIDDILKVKGLDAILIGPYDLSASLGATGKFQDPEFVRVMEHLRQRCGASGIPCGVHVVAPSPQDLHARIAEGYRFLPYSLDAVLLRGAAACPSLQRSLNT
jgi:2-dehydro-3-deoxyglucarate aldolase